MQQMGKCLRCSRHSLLIASAVLMFSLLAGGVAARDRAKLDIVPAVRHSAMVGQIAFAPGGSRVLSDSIEVALPPDGARVVTGNIGGTARLWDTSPGRLRAFDGHFPILVQG